MKNRNQIVSEIVDAGLTRKFMTALGWQGGTVHQVADELIKRDLANLPLAEALRTIESERR